MNDIIDLEQTEEEELEAFVNAISDEMLEAAASGEKITFTFSIHPMYCQFC
jgi:nucleoid DNA-binding protein